MPFLFYKYGHLLRRNSRYAPWTPPGDSTESPCSDKVAQPDESEALEPEYAPDAGEHAGAEGTLPEMDPEKRVAALA